ncbi:ABC-three component system protein [Lysinibacillus sp. NPDC097162]|uniref:ABC-three component system protein n=1 Tax=Lysinibacillus sp. NPDC097162 TaxID=3364140 RepID=UPI0037F559D3
MGEKTETVSQKYLSNTHVPDKVYAYSIQVKHALYELIQNNGVKNVSVEVFEDVGVETLDNSKKAVQMKSSLSNNNPVSNRAVDLWKTLYNWLISIELGELDVGNTSFTLFVNKECTGVIVESFHKAFEDENAAKAWEIARTEFYDSKNNEKDLAEGYKKFIIYFFDQKNKEAAIKLIKKFKLKTIETKYTEFLFDTFKRVVMIPDELIEFSFDKILGWIDRITSKMVENGYPMVVSYSDYKEEMVDIVRILNQNKSLVELAPYPRKNQIEKEFDQVKNYIKQLGLIECDYTDKIEAISDYLRAASNRTIWASKRLVDSNSIDDFEEELKRTWRNKDQINNITHSHLNEIQQGKLLYFHCQEDKKNIIDRETPVFFMRGCYHALSDSLEIGWRRNYKNLLENKEK